ncbi:integrase, catalytic region, zinc finger, CCHC-type containing protein [Tanacetum coccineum]
MSGCRENQKVKYTAGSFIGKALTWWNSQVQTRGLETAVGITWEDFKILKREEFCLNNKMQKLEIEFGVTSWSELAMLRTLIGSMSLLGPYTPTIVTTPIVPATENSLAVPEETTIETVMNMTPENRAHFESEKEAIHLILTELDNRNNTQLFIHVRNSSRKVEAIESLQQGNHVNIQDLRQTNIGSLVNSSPLMKEKQLSLTTQDFNKYKEINIRNNWQFATMQNGQESMNPLAIVATHKTLQDPYYQSSKPHKSYEPTSKASLPTRSHATTRYKGKEIAKPITPPSESASEEDSDPEKAQRDKDMQKILALIAKYFKKIYKPTNNNLRTSSNTRNKNVDTTPRYKNDNQTGQFRNQRAVNVAGARETVGGQVVQQSGIQCFNCKEFGHYAKECRKPKRVKDSTYHRKRSCCEVPNADSGTDAEPLEQVQYDTDDNVFANDIQHFEQSESITNTCAVETGDSNVIPDSPDMCDNDIQDDQNDVECDDERVALANFIS